MADGRSAVGVEIRGNLGVLRLSGRHGNALNDDLLDGLEAGLASLAGQPKIRGILLASGGKLFSPGLDLQELVDLDRPGMDRFMRTFRDRLLDLVTCPKPVVAALSGHAVAGGCVLALTADWRILQRGKRIGLNEIQVGVPLPFGVSSLLLASVAPHRLTEIALMGRNFSDEAAVAAGLAHEVLDPEGFEAGCLERLEELASKDAPAFQRTKSDLRAEVAERLREEDAARRSLFLDCWFSPGTRERIDAIVDGLRRR